MQDFQSVRNDIFNGGNQNTIGDDPPLSCNFNAGGGGFQASIVAELNQGVHITIFQTSWDGTINIPDLGGEQVSIGPFCLHLTAAGNDRWFLQYDEAQNRHWVTDYGTPNERVLKTLEAMLNTLEPYLK